ncbi:uncharacterized protein [Nicotiana tomentosiformis]|uniref:uncharacterized protein n=1 Tax=Nicotiana tomentosiformis TaxID=4098 RepID=UPI00388CA1DA
MHLISQLDPLKYIFQKPMLTEKLAKWKILLSEFDIVYITQKAIKGQALADYHAENLVDGDYESLTTYFLDEEVLFAGEDIAESYPGWRMFLDEAANFKGVRIEVVLISKFGQHYPASPNIRLPCTHNMDEYEACILRIRMAVEMNAKELLVTGDCDLLIHQVQGEWSTKNVKILLYPHCVKEICKKFTKIDFKHVPRIQNEFVDAFANLSSMIQHPDKNYTDLIEVEAGAFSHIHEQEVITFIWRNIICRFSLPKEISCDNGPQFTGRRTTEFFEKWYIKRILSTAYHPASNGQAESFNKTILNIMKKELEEVKGLWPEILPEVLWAHKTTPKMSTGDTPYSLIYGTETVIPIKVGEPSMRKSRQRLILIGNHRREAPTKQLEYQPPQGFLKEFFNKTMSGTFQIEVYKIKPIFHCPTPQVSPSRTMKGLDILGLGLERQPTLKTSYILQNFPRAK